MDAYTGCSSTANGAMVVTLPVAVNLGADDDGLYRLACAARGSSAVMARLMKRIVIECNSVVKDNQ